MTRGPGGQWENERGADNDLFRWPGSKRRPPEKGSLYSAGGVECIGVDGIGLTKKMGERLGREGVEASPTQGWGPSQMGWRSHLCSLRILSQVTSSNHSQFHVAGQSSLTVPGVRDMNGLAVFTGILSPRVEVQAGKGRERGQEDAGPWCWMLANQRPWCSGNEDYVEARRL